MGAAARVPRQRTPFCGGCQAAELAAATARAVALCKHRIPWALSWCALRYRVFTQKSTNTSNPWPLASSECIPRGRSIDHGRGETAGQCQAPLVLPGWHHLPLPSAPCWAHLGKGWARSRPRPRAPAQPWVHWGRVGGHTHSTASRNPHGPNQRSKGRFCSVFPILFIVRMQHGTLALWNHQLHPEPFSLFPLSPISIGLCPFHCGWLNLLWSNPQQKKKLEFLIRLMQSPRFISSTVNQPSLKTQEQKVPEKYSAIFYWCRVFPS